MPCAKRPVRQAARVKPEEFESILGHAPFKRFTFHVDGRSIDVNHPEQVLLTPDKQTVVVALPDAGIQILDMERISSIRIRGRRSSSRKSGSGRPAVLH